VGDLQYFQEIPIERLREQVIEQLKLHYAHDNLTVEEFEQRIERASAVEEKLALLEVVKDLPSISDSSRSAAANNSGQAAINMGEVRQQQDLVAIFSGTERKGMWYPARNMKILAAFGGVDLDFSKALLPPGDTYIDAMCVFGGVDIVVPEGVNLEISGVPIFGGIDNKYGDRRIPGAPTLHISAFALFGGIDIKPVKKRRR
jgi:hypothetical protein